MISRVKNDGQVFDGIYSIVERRLRANGMENACSRDAFVAVRGLRLGEIDGIGLTKLDNRSFVDAVYLTAWNRPPTDDERDVWRDDIQSLPPSDFQRKFMGWLASKRKNNAFAKPSPVAILLNKTYNHVFLKTPEPFQKFVRDHFKGGRK